MHIFWLELGSNVKLHPIKAGEKHPRSIPRLPNAQILGQVQIVAIHCTPSNPFPILMLGPKSDFVVLFWTSSLFFSFLDKQKSLGREEAILSRHPQVSLRTYKRGLSPFLNFYKLPTKRDCRQRDSNLCLTSEDNAPYQLNQPSQTLFFFIWVH